MLVIGFDPGNRVGWCLLEIGGTPSSGMTARWVEHGEIVLQPPRPRRRKGAPPAAPPPRMRDRDFDARVRELCALADVVAIEQVSGFPHGKNNFVRAKALQAAGQVGATIATIARALAQKPVEQMPAGRSRLLVVGRNNADDATIKVAVRRLIRGVPASTSEHARDAAVVALAVGWSKPRLGAA